ncbi:MAG: magnesium transporter [Firmicutes bacterium]|nr:magnesium transporter [Bacillota bacterium]
MTLDRIKFLLKNKDYTRLKTELLQEHQADIAEFINELDAKTSLMVFRLLPKDVAANVFAYLAPESRSQILLQSEETELHEILDELFFDDKIDFLEEMPANVVKRILRNSSEAERKLINLFLNYPENTAGSLMTIELVDLKKEMTVSEALEKIRRVAPNRETIYTCYVTDATRYLEGILSLRDLVIASPEQKLETIMRKKIISVSTLDDKEYVADLIKKYDLIAIPVTDTENRLVGIITVDDIVDVIEDESTEDIHKMASIGEIDVDLQEASPMFLTKKRLPWLLILVFVNIFSGLGIALFEETLQTVIALVFFLPLLIDSAGNAGSQSATLIIRALALGEIKIDDWLELLKKELVVSLALGLSMAAAVSAVGFVRGGLDLAIVTSLSMAAVVLVGSTIGLCLPFLLSKFQLDPATASGPLVTSIADIAGVIIYFSIASWYYGI